MFKLMLNFLVCILILSAGLNNYVLAQTPTARDKDLLTTHLEKVYIEEENLSQALSLLSRAYDIPIGLEISANDDDSPVVIDFNTGTLAELLAEIVKTNSIYTWEIRDGVINVFPKAPNQDPVIDDMLATKLDSFSIKPKINCFDVALSLINTPELSSFLKLHSMSYRVPGFSGVAYPQVGRNFQLDVSNKSLRSILNTVVMKSSTAKYWFIIRYKDDPTTLNLGCDANPENGFSLPQR